jgi:hypothetical protein
LDASALPEDHYFKHLDPFVEFYFTNNQHYKTPTKRLLLSPTWYFTDAHFYTTGNEIPQLM